MADTVIKNGQGWVIAVTDEISTSVPYHPVDRADGSRNHGFMDLRDRPDLVALIPEAQRSHGLARLLGAANAPGSCLMTIGCECGLFPTDHASPDQPSHYVGSYISVTFRDPAYNVDPDSLARFAEAILSKVEITDQHVIYFEMIVEPLRKFFGLDGRFALMIRPMGFGSTPESAWNAFDHACTATAEAVARHVSTTAP